MRWILPKFFLLLLCACTSTPAIHRYTLHSAPAPAQVTPFPLQGGLGVGPIEMPESWRRGEVVTWGDNNQITADARHLWAGDPKLAISRVLAANLSQQLQLDDVWAHPWDARVKPQHQILLVIESFGGQLGGTVELRAKWRLMKLQDTRPLITERKVFSITAADKSHAAYVAAENQLVHELSAQLEQSVRAHF